MTLGNHEFDDNIEGLLPFLENQTVPIVVTNLKLDKVPEVAKFIKSSVTIPVGGVDIGIVGYLTPETKFISNPGDKVIFEDEVEALKKETKKLKDSGVNI